MKSLLRPSLLVAFLVLLVGGAVLILFQTPSSLAKPQPLSVAADEREVVWLYPATNGAAWERFITALRYTATRLQVDQPGWEAQTEGAFPQQTTVVPEAALTRPGGGRLVFRWYKLTSDWKSRDWIEALLARNPPPLAIIGGSTSDAARDLASQLQSLGAAVRPELRPLLLLTTATADRVALLDTDAPTAVPPVGGDPMENMPGVPLGSLYTGRVFRFCFTNRQMARAVTRFLWNHLDLFPDADPVHMVQWEDDAYSVDLSNSFLEELRNLMGLAAAQDWAWLASNFALGGSPPSLAGGVFPYRRAGELGSNFRMALETLPTPQRIEYSVGTFDRPNRFEQEAARNLLDEMERRGISSQKRPLLVVTGQSAPTRRFLRALDRTAPEVARRFTVVTGDAIAFNTVYRDREVAWPIQDLPFSLVFFCHHNPIDARAGFRPLPTSKETPEPGSTELTGTEDVLLYADIIESVARALPRPPSPPINAEQLAKRFGSLRVRGEEAEPARLFYDEEGKAPERLFFDPEGNRQRGTGEHVVSVRPQFRGERILPQAMIEVWSWQRNQGPTNSWHRHGEPLLVYYDGSPRAGD